MNEMLSIKTPDGTFSAYVERPSAEPAPAVIVLQEIFGVNADLRRTAAELAALGFIAICPDLFWRQVPNVDLSDKTDWETGFKLYQAYDPNHGVQDIVAAIEAARVLPSSTGKVGVTGFCLGGLMSFLTAARSDVDAAVVYYGGSIEQHLDEAPNVQAPIMMHFGEEDEFISKNAQAAIAEAMSGDADAELFFYPGCAHAFARHDGTKYDEAAARTANARTAAFLKRHLGAA